MMKRRLRWFFSSFILVFVGIAFYFWTQRTQVENQLIDTVIRKISPSLPFQIESYQLARNLKSLDLKILWNGNEISFKGPLSLHWLGKHEGWRAQYDPLVQIADATPVHFKIALAAPADFSSVKKMVVTANESVFTSKKWGVEIKSPNLSVAWSEDESNFQFDTASSAWTNPLQSQEAVSIQNFSLAGTTKDSKKFAAVDLLFTADDVEILWNSFYTDLAAKGIPLSLQIKNQKSGHLEVGKNGIFQADFDQNNFNWKTGALPLPALVALAEKSFPSDIQVKKGALQTSGSLQFDLDLHQIAITTAALKIDHLTAHSPEKEMTARDLSLTTSFQQNAKQNPLQLAVKDFFYRHFVAHLPLTELKWNRHGIQTLKNLPLVIERLPITVGALKMEWSPEFRLKTSVDIVRTDIRNLTQGFCMDARKLPPSTAEVHFKELEFSPSMIDPTGKIEFQLFNGKIELNEIAFYDLNTDIPEIDFDTEWSGIGLQPIGDWIGFGEMQGTLEGYAHDVVFQSFLPTQYQFKIQVMPLDRESESAHVDLSPEAMKNFVKVFTGENLDQEIPGIAGWMMFGWPSHLLGGYDVYYAGMQLSSEDGKILVETLDPDSIFKREQKHFVLYGPRFKMPLRTLKYPLLIDATAMSNFVHQFSQQLLTMKAEKDAKKKETEKGDPLNVNDDSINCDPPEN